MPIKKKEDLIHQAVGGACVRICDELDVSAEDVAETLLSVVATLAIVQNESADDFGARARGVYLEIIEEVALERATDELRSRGLTD